MLNITKVLVISKEISEYERIKRTLSSLKFFQLDYETHIKREANYYDFVIADLNSLDGPDESKIIDNLIQAYRRSTIILLGERQEGYLNKRQRKIPILSKPISEVELLECIFNAILEEVSSI